MIRFRLVPHLSSGRPNNLVDPDGDLLHLLRSHPARSHGRRSDANPRRVERLARVERDRVVVRRDRARSSALAAGLPGTPLPVRSIRIRWLSVPPETRSKPRSKSRRPASSRWRSSAARNRRTAARAPRRGRRPSQPWCGCAGPLETGKTARSRTGACSASESIARARRVCGWWSRYPACRPATDALQRRLAPAMWAMSATRIAPTSRAISENAANSSVRGMAVPAQKISFGRSLVASAHGVHPAMSGGRRTGSSETTYP